MKVTFTCEKCGFAYEVYTTAPGRTPRTTVEAMWSVNEQRPCPNCSKLTYGPLTEEMVAEALYEAGHGESTFGKSLYKNLTEVGGRPDYYQRQARFVLRLLNELDDTRIGYESTWPDEWFSGPPVESWLLKLAREK